jgi:Zn-finger nucleic acid-binding protein
VEKRMKCPRCDVLLNEITKAGVLVDVCDRCRWSDLFDIFD